MKASMFVLFGILAACGGEPTESLGTLEQPIYLPTDYGMEDGGKNYKCDGDWDGDVCLVPNDKDLTFFIDGYNCPNWYKQRMQNAVIDVNTMISPLGWRTRIVGINDPWDFVMFCETESTGPEAHSWFRNGMDCHDTTRGELCQTKGGYIALRPNYIESKPIFQNATLLQRIRKVANDLRHEIGHMLGLGHHRTQRQGKLLMDNGFPDDLSSDAWNKFLGFTQEELRDLECYNPDKGGSDCD